MPIGKTENFTSEIQQRLCELAKALGKSNREFSRSIGKSDNYVASLGNDISLGVVNKISTVYPQVNILWLITGEGDKMLTKPIAVDLQDYILNDLSRSGTYIKSSGMYSGEDKEMLFLVVSYKEAASLKFKIKEFDPRAFVVITDAYDAYGEGWKELPSASDITPE